MNVVVLNTLSIVEYIITDGSHCFSSRVDASGRAGEMRQRVV